MINHESIIIIQGAKENTIKAVFLHRGYINTSYQSIAVSAKFGMWFESNVR